MSIYYISGFKEEVLRPSKNANGSYPAPRVKEYFQSLVGAKRSWTWFEVDKDARGIAKEIHASHPLDKEITVFGHSFGGDSAYKLTLELAELNRKVYLITIDPVSRVSKPAKVPPHPGAHVYWINLAPFPRSRSLKREAWGDFVARLGGPWDLKTGANVNIPTGGHHGDIRAMCTSLKLENLPPDDLRLVKELVVIKAIH